MALCRYEMSFSWIDQLGDALKLCEGRPFRFKLVCILGCAPC